MTDDLLALLVEVTSVTASGRQMKKPLEIPRPNDKPKSVEAPTGRTEKDAAFKKGISVLAATSRSVVKQ